MASLTLLLSRMVNNFTMNQKLMGTCLANHQTSMNMLNMLHHCSQSEFKNDHHALTYRYCYTWYIPYYLLLCIWCVHVEGLTLEVDFVPRPSACMLCSHYVTKSPGNEVASFPGVPHFCFSVYVQYNTRKRKISVFCCILTPNRNTKTGEAWDWEWGQTRLLFKLVSAREEPGNVVN